MQLLRGSDVEIAQAKEWDDEGRRRAGLLVDGFLDHAATHDSAPSGGEDAS